jgi:hypothetical protein
MSTLTSTPVADLAVGDVIDSRKRLTGDVRPAEVTRLQGLRHGRTRVWVRSIHQQRSILSDWAFGSFAPTDTVNRVGA